MTDKQKLKAFLDRKVEEYNKPAFIEADPVSVPHLFTKKQDIEISGFFAAVFAWGNRTTIIRKCRELMALMENSPHQFIVQHAEKDRKRFEGFCHRTFNTTDLLYFIAFLQQHYRRYDSLEQAFRAPGFKKRGNKDGGREVIEASLNHFSDYFFSLEESPARTRKHIPSPARNSGCKRLNMFMRWMVRRDRNGVDFGLWKKFEPSDLICPIDLHVARVAKRFGLLRRPASDWKAALELTAHLRVFDKEDPAKYDFALFALGVIEKF